MKKDDFKIFKNIPLLKTERLELRKIQIKDLRDVYEYTSDPSVSKYLMWHPHKNCEYTKAYLRYISKLYRKGKFYDWAITLDGKMIGTVGFTSININNNYGEIGYVLGSAFWGKGIATEAVSEIIRFGFHVLALNRIEAVFLPENERSKRVLIKCGLKSEGIRRAALMVKGEYRDVEVFSIIKEEYVKGINNK